MVAPWQATGISLKLPDGSRLIECVEAEDTLELSFDGLKPVASVDAEFWRITTSNERTSATSPDAVLVENGVSDVAIVGNLFTVTVTEFVRTETYRLVLVVHYSDGRTMPGTWIVRCVA